MEPNKPDSNVSQTDQTAQNITPPPTLAEIEAKLNSERAQAAMTQPAVPAAPVAPAPELLPAVETAFQPDVPPTFTPVPTQKSRKLQPKQLKIIGIAVVVLLIIIAIASLTGKATPDGTFTAMLNDSLSTKSYEASVQDPTAVSTGTIDFELKSLKQPVVSTSLSTGKTPNVTALNSYYTLQDGLVKFNSLSTGDPVTDQAVAPILGKWIQTRQNGSNLAASNVATFGATVSPQSLLFGAWPIANLKSSDRKTLVSWVIANQVYKYDSAQVFKDTIGGHSVYAYDITINAAKLVAYNQKVATLMGLNASDISAATTQISNNPKEQVTLYADISTHRLDRMVTQASSDIKTTNYSKYQKATVPAEPKASYTSTQFVQALESAAQGTTH